MFELIVILGLLFAGLAFLAIMLKLVIALVLLPIKLALWFTKGILALVLFIPLAVVGTVVFAGAAPLIALFVVLPLALFAAAVIGFFRLIF